ncbi:MULTISPECIES: allophanate hydrolase subunit 1 [unclassified Rathayibacter]|uniref:5-oxoprolinase subunit B family protein n=1 Tax=unclassified Rathayibacter TaxID=2609250 RepID=UPI001FB1BF2E|nr:MULTISPECIES: allophanate hydrolase subunit 1 [unclassified Rathayibacter]MCJ1672526.1 allophanate hydrolase subunit 1 [Rathayibacter sp. VKM Ac-2929]MCJ1682005.1 allophanate hydrolase subunit 1 [Rathayibacter sp. VKM Ac-2928]MCJ1686051.1 allophanate hydrolase subunit 1 [Rathayibacter sp. VKM Ac-2927]
MIPVRLLPSGDRAVLAEVDGLDEALALAAALDRSRPAGVLDLVPAARTVLVVLDESLPVATASPWILRTAEATEPNVPGTVGRRHEIAVRYDGVDLAEAADALGWTTAELIRRHTATPWRAAFGGFAPGFAYLVALTPWPEVARRAEPRTRVPAGAVALAAGYSGVYPRSSPGGWQLIGSTDAELWDIERLPPALLAPGDEVRFRALP